MGNIDNVSAHRAAYFFLIDTMKLLLDVAQTKKGGQIRLPFAWITMPIGTALAEYYWGGGVGCNRLLVVTVGSGIGVGVIIDGKLIRYTFGTAGELGSIVVDAQSGKGAFLGGPRWTGKRGIGPGHHRSIPIPSSPPPGNVAELGRVGPPREPAAAIIRRAGWWLGVGIASWAAIFCPDRVLIGGGVAACGRPFLDAARQSALEMTPGFYGERFSIEFARLGNRAGCVGAGSLILKHPNRMTS